MTYSVSVLPAEYTITAIQDQSFLSCSQAFIMVATKDDRHPVLARILLLLELGRVRFLVYSPIAYAAGVAAATVNTPATGFTTPLFLIGQLFVSATHMLTHFFNEYYDLPADALHEFPSPWTGGSRVLPNRKVRPLTSFHLGVALTALTLPLLAFFPNTETKLIAFVIVVFAIGYSAPPLMLGNRGLGEFDVMLVLNILVPLFGYSLFRNESSNPTLLMALIPTAIVEFVRMMVMNMADVVGDSRAGKMTLVVRLGLDRSVFYHMLGMAAAYLSMGMIFLAGMMHRAVLFLEICTLPMAGVICWRLFFKREYLSLTGFYNLPFVSTQHNGLILIAALLGLVWTDEARGVTSMVSQVRLLGVYVFFVQNGLKVWKGWRDGKLAAVFNPQIKGEDRIRKRAQIVEWEQGIALAARPFKSYNKRDD